MAAHGSLEPMVLVRIQAGERVAGSAPETLNARGGSVRQARPKGGTMRHPAKREPSGDESRVRLGAGLGNESMQVPSL